MEAETGDLALLGGRDADRPEFLGKVGVWRLIAFFLLAIGDLERARFPVSDWFMRNDLYLPFGAAAAAVVAVVAAVVEAGGGNAEGDASSRSWACFFKS